MAELNNEIIEGKYIFMSKLQPTSLFMVGLATPASSFVQLILCMVFFVIVGKRRKAIV